MLKKLRRKNHQNNDLEIKKKLKLVDNQRDLQKYQQIKTQKRLKIAQENAYSVENGGYTPFLVIKKELGADYKKEMEEKQQLLKLGEANGAKDSQEEEKAVNVSEPDMKAVLKKIKEHDLEMQQHKSNIFVHKKDPDVVMEKKMLEERKTQLKHSMETLKTFIGAAEKQDSN